MQSNNSSGRSSPFDPPPPKPPPGTAPDRVCPVCGEPLIQESCKVVCRSEVCVYRIVLTCSEF